MDLFSGKKNILLPKSISATLVAVLILNSLFFALIFYPQKAEAFGPGDAMNFTLQPLQYSLETSNQVLQKSKFSLDLAYQLKETEKGLWERFASNNSVIAEIVSSLLLVMMHQVLAKITNDIVAWINGGGKGQIRVLQDPGQFLEDALNEAGGVLAGAILNVDPKTLCDASYLKFTLKAAFTGPYSVPTFDEKVACTFTGAADGLRKFQENFTDGGWASFIELSRKENNQLGQSLIVAEEMAKIKSEKKAESTAKLGISKGFLAQEKCTITKGAQWGGYDRVEEEAFSQNTDELVGKTLEEAFEKVKNFDQDAPTDLQTFKKYWILQGGEVACKTVTPAEQISELASTALQAPMKRLEDSITSLTNKLGTGAGSVIKPYVLAIASAGLNLLLNKGIGLIQNSLASVKKPRKARRQATYSLQENTMLAQSAGALAGTINNFRSFLLKAMLEFSLYVSTATAAANSINVLGRIPLNRGEAELRGGTWYLGGGCPSGYDQNNLTFSGAPYSCAYDVNAIATNPAGKIFFEEAKWCGAYYQEIPIVVTEKPPTNITPPMPAENPVNIASIAAAHCPRIVYFNPGTGTEVAQAGACDATNNQVTYDLNGDGSPEIATHLIAYDDKETLQGDRFIRHNTVGTINANGIPANISAGSFVFEETLVNTIRDVNRNSFTDSISTSPPSALQGLFEMRPYYTNAVTNAATSAAVLRLPQGLAQTAVATTATDGYVFGGYNQFGHSKNVFRLSDGALVASLPIAVSGSVAVYYPPNGRIYLFGGFDSARAYATIWEFNPANQTFRTMSGRLPEPAAGFAAAYYSPTGRIYLFGGNNNGTISNQILEYNQATDTLVAKIAKFPSAVAFAAAAPAAKNPPSNTQQRIYVFGGITNKGYASNAVFEYDPTAPDDSSSLTRKSVNIEARGFIAAAPASANAIMLAGGQSEYGYLSTVERYNANNDSLTQLPLLAEPRSKAGGGIIGGIPVLVGGVSPLPSSTSVSAESGRVFPQGDIYHIPAATHSESITSSFWQKYFSTKFKDGSVTLHNTRTKASYADFTATIRDPAISTVTNDDSNLVSMPPLFYPELYEKIQELMEKTRIIDGYNYSTPGAKNYRSGLADQLGAVPDDDPYDNNPSNPQFSDRDPNGDGIIEEHLGEQEGYKGSVTDVLTAYNNLTQTYQTLFSGITDENALEGVDKNMKILSPRESNIKLALIGSRCPATPPSATSTPDLAAQCPRFGDEYNMARRFIFEADDTGANPEGITTGFATNPFTGEKSSALAGILNLDEMATQLQSLPPDKNIIKLVRLRQVLEQLQVWKSTDASNPDYQKSIVRIPVPGKANTFIEPRALIGVDTVQVSLPSYEKIEKYLNATSTADSAGAVVPDKNRGIQTLIEDYGYATAKEAYPEISKHLDEALDDAVNQTTDKLKEVFLKRIEEQLEESRVVAQHRLQRFIEYVRDINGTVKLGVSKQRGDQLAGLNGVDVAQIKASAAVLRINAHDMFTNNSQNINELLSRTPLLRLTNDERNGIIGSAIYKIKTMAKFMGVDTTTAEFSTRMSQYTAVSGTTAAEREAGLDQRMKNALKDVYMYYTGIFSQTDETLPPQKRNIVSSCGQDAAMGYYCKLTTLDAKSQPVKIYKDARTKLDELQNDFSLMVEETLKVSEEYNTLFSDVSSEKMDLNDLTKLLKSLSADYDQGNVCVGLPTDATNLWGLNSALAAKLTTQLGATTVSYLSTTEIIGSGIGAVTGFMVGGPLGALLGAGAGAAIGAAINSFLGDWGDDDAEEENKRRREEAERREQQRQALLSSCRTGIANYNKHLGQLADQFICNKTNSKYED